MWLMNKELDRLTYPRDYPLYAELKAPVRQNRALQGNLAFIAEISANGLLEWALRPIQQEASYSNYDHLRREYWQRRGSGLGSLCSPPRKTRQLTQRIA